MQHTGHPWAEIRDMHPGTEHFEQLFSTEHLPDDLAFVANQFAVVARRMVEDLQDGQELSAGLRKLVEAKDCCVRQRVIDRA
jgi:hypothetical protein